MSKTIHVKVGSVTVAIYPAKASATAKRLTYEVRYHLLGKIERKKFGKKNALARATAFAKTIATQLANGESRALQMTGADAASLAHVRQILSKHGLAKPLAEVVEEYCAMYGLLVPLNATPHMAAGYYAQHHSTGPQKLFAAIKTEFLAEKELDGTLDRHYRDMDARLTKLESSFQCSLASLTAGVITSTLDALQKKFKWTNRTRNHYRAALSNLCTFAIEKKHVPREWHEMDFVKRFKEHDGQIEIFDPKEIAAFLKHTPDDMIPAMVVAFFSEVRTSEVIGRKRDGVPPVDWRDIDLSTGEVIVTGKVRTTGDRVSHLPANAIAWLRPHAKQSGPIYKGCERWFYEKRGKIVAKVAEEIPGFKWKDNAARRTAISRRAGETHDMAKVSDESGSSVGTLTKRYRRVIKGLEVARYNSILPGGHEKVVQMPSAVPKSSQNSVDVENNLTTKQAGQG